MVVNRELAPIVSGVIYPLDCFQRSVGFGRFAMRQARRKGLRIIRVGGRAFVRGSDFLAFVDRIADDHGSDMDDQP